MSDWTLQRKLGKMIEGAVYFPYLLKKTNFSFFVKEILFFLLYFNK